MGTAALFSGDDPALGLLILAAAGIAAGVINTIAGGGSFLTLPLLMGLGLPAGTANGTLRIAVLFQNVTATLTFHRQGVREYPALWRLAPPMCAGALAGSWLATQVPDDTLRRVIGGILLAWALLLIARPGGWTDAPDTPRRAGVWAVLGSLGIGLYGGFLQAGVGFPILAMLVSGLGFGPVRANAVKVSLVLAYTCLAVPVFAHAGQIAWREGVTLALAAALGGWLGTRWQLKSGAKLVRWVVIVTVLVSGFAMLAG